MPGAPWRPPAARSRSRLRTACIDNHQLSVEQRCMQNTRPLLLMSLCSRHCVLPLLPRQATTKAQRAGRRQAQRLPRSARPGSRGSAQGRAAEAPGQGEGVCLARSAARRLVDACRASVRQPGQCARQASRASQRRSPGVPARSYAVPTSCMGCRGELLSVQSKDGRLFVDKAMNFGKSELCF